MRILSFFTIKERVLNHGSFVSGPFIRGMAHMSRLDELSSRNSRDTTNGIHKDKNENNENYNLHV